MAKLGWIGSVGLAVGAAAGAAAAQFGLGYGLGIISWSPTGSGGHTTLDGVWLSSLAWTLWIAANSTVVGAICADRRSAGEIGSAPPRTDPRHGNMAPPSPWATGIWRSLLAVSAAIGALLAVALVLVPARAAIRPDTSTPQLIAAGYAVVGIAVGIIVAVCTLATRAAAVNVVVTAVWLWLLAVATVIDGVVAGRGLGTAPLGVWPFGDNTYFRHTWSLPGALLMLGGALLIGAGAAWRAASRGDGRTGASLSGAIGPLLVAVAYSLTVPGLVGIDEPQLSAFLLSPYALIAGVTGSVLLVAAVTSRRGRGAAPGLAASASGRAQVRSTPDGPAPKTVRIPVGAVSTSRDDATVPQQPTPVAAKPSGAGKAATGSAPVPAPSGGARPDGPGDAEATVKVASATTPEDTRRPDGAASGGKAGEAASARKRRR